MLPTCGHGRSIPYLMLFRTGRYFRTKSTVFGPLQLRRFLSEVDLLFRKWKRIIRAFHQGCFYLRLLISNANSNEVRVWWRPVLWVFWDFVAYASLYVVMKHAPQQHLRYWSDFGGKNSDEKSENSLSFPGKKKTTLDKKRRSCTGVNTVRLVRKYLRMRNNIK